MGVPLKSFRCLSEEPDRGQLLLELRDLIHEAGNPYYDWFFRGPDSARAALTTLVVTPSSEVSATRATLLFTDDSLAGMYIAVSGEDLNGCRLSDTLVLLSEPTRSAQDREALRARIEESRELITPIGSSDFFLSKIGVVPRARGRGLGRSLLDHYIATGTADGFTRFRLDVSSDNARAIRLYRARGFTIASEHHLAGMSYLEMVLPVTTP